ncbi:MAG: peptidase MA family metallohydrolase [Phycisphaerales bacterium]
MKLSAMLVLLAGVAVAMPAFGPSAAAQSIRPGRLVDAEPPREGATPAAEKVPGVSSMTVDAGDLSPAVTRALEAPFRTPEERRVLRLFHGAETHADITTVAERAALALVRGDFYDPSLTDPAAATLDRVGGMIERGELAEALVLLGEDDSARALYLRSSALEMLGLRERAATEARKAAPRVARASDAAEIVWLVRTLTISLRLNGPGNVQTQGQPEEQYQALINHLARARQADPLYWPARLAEAELLLEKDSFDFAMEAISEGLALNPRSAELVALRGEVSALGFQLPMVEADAAVLDGLSTMHSEAYARDGTMDRSVLAAELRVRGLLRQNAPDLALEAIDKVIQMYPAAVNRRKIALARLSITAVRYDFDALDRELAAYDALNAEQATRAGVGAAATALCPRGAFAAGRALSEARQYDQSVRMLRLGAERSPTWAQPWNELGLVLVQAARDDEAREALERAQELDPFNIRASNSLKLVREVATFPTIQSDHFIVRSRPGVDALIAREMIPHLEAMHEVVTGRQRGGLDHVPPRKTVVELMPNHEWFAVRIAGMPQIHTIAAATGPLISMEAPRDGAGHKGAYDWLRTVRHEYAHTVGLSRTNNRIPHWFTEAQGVYLELAPRAYPTLELLTQAFVSDRLMTLDKINIAFVRPERPSDRGLAYAQAHFMLEFMIETFGDRAPLELMDRYAKGVREEEAFSQVLGISRQEFFERFLVFAESKLTQWGMLPPASMPSINELITREENARAAAAADPAEPAAEPAPEPEPVPVEVTPALVERWLSEYPEHPDLLELAVREALRKSGDEPTPQVVVLLERYEKARPVDPLTHRLLARAALARINATQTPSKEDLDAARRHLAFLDEREERTSAFSSELAAVYARLGDWPNALASAERAVRLAPYVARLREQAASIAVHVGGYDSARNHLEVLAALEPDEPRHRQRLEALQRRIDQSR